MENGSEANAYSFPQWHVHVQSIRTGMSLLTFLSALRANPVLPLHLLLAVLFLVVEEGSAHPAPDQMDMEKRLSPPGSWGCCLCPVK